MTDTNAITRQPTQLDYASPAQFKFKITKSEDESAVHNLSLV